ncbi:MAG: PQQ-dependent sugar dehydrogenase [Pirellulales bacterium]|nr:PQQ-dependent sugar dehydrogenase [Pirellulales bacterium]
MRWLLISAVLWSACAHGAHVAAEESRSVWENTRLRGTPEPPAPYTVERAFSRVTWPAPLYVAPVPASNELLVILQGGEAERPARIVSLENRDEAEKFETLLEVPGRIVYALAFDARFAENGALYVFSNGPTGQSQRVDRVSRYTVRREARLALDSATEQVILEWDSAGHDGGDLAFDADGMLLIAAGDGSSDSDTLETGQNLTDLLGTILRIDVAHPDGERPYRVPPDNPFVNVPGARGEIWAYGLRNPWRIDCDRATGELWVGNNGQDLWETAHLVRRGDNLGWSVYEGNHPFYLHRIPGPTPVVPTTIEHSHADFRSLTGGVVYHGDRFPELEGAYVYGDYSTGKIWAARHRDGQITWSQELADTTLQITAFRVDQRGDLLVVDHGGGIFRLARNMAPDAPIEFPQTLSETGLFAAVAEHRPAPGLVPYTVNAPGWADGADAERFLALPAEVRIDFKPTGGWGFDEGAVLVQTLAREGRRLETRLLVKHQGEWAGYSYRWNEAQTEAELVPKSGADTDAWHFPSRAECLACHSRAANFVLGLSEAQANVVEPDGTSQLSRFEQLGLFREPLARPPGESPHLVDPRDSVAPSGDRARSYLHANCSMCHVAAGGGNARMELGFGTAVAEMHLIEARPQHDTFGLVNAMLVAPGQPEQSVLLHRLSRRGPGQMPPLVSRRVDEQAVELFRAWIAELPPTRPFVRAWTLAESQAALAAEIDQTTHESGARLFREIGCAECHRRGAEGRGMGPDLTDVGRRLNADKLLESLVEPSATIAEGYAAVILELDDGRTVTGKIASEDERRLVLRTGPTYGEQVVIERSTIVTRGISPVSNMPTGLLNTLTLDEIAQLIAYLRTP